MESTSVEEAIRVSHCSADDRDHKCLGTCTITPTGIKLSCPLCGDDDATGETKLSGYTNLIRVGEIRSLCHAIGVDWEALSVERQLQVLEHVKNRECPGCGRPRNLQFGRHYMCDCRNYMWDDSWSRWRKRQAQDREGE